jgi:hypothetical protein
LIEAHLVKSTAAKRLPKSRGKGAGAEVDTLASVLLAARIISVLLSLEFTLAESYHILVCLYMGVFVVAFVAAFFHPKIHPKR